VFSIVVLLVPTLGTVVLLPTPACRCGRIWCARRWPAAAAPITPRRWRTPIRFIPSAQGLSAGLQCWGRQSRGPDDPVGGAGAVQSRRGEPLGQCFRAASFVR